MPLYRTKVIFDTDASSLEETVNSFLATANIKKLKDIKYSMVEECTEGGEDHFYFSAMIIYTARTKSRFFNLINNHTN